MIIVDVEMTGLDPKKHSIVSIGALDFYNPNNQFYQECRIWEGAEIFEGNTEFEPALKRNGFTLEQITDKSKPSVEQIIDFFVKWTNTCNVKLLAGHNPFIEYQFLKNSAERAKIEWPFAYRTVDLYSIFYEYILRNNLVKAKTDDPKKQNLDHILNYVGLPNETRPHNALTGAKMEAEAFSRLIHKRNLLKDFESYELPWYMEETKHDCNSHKIDILDYNPSE